MAFEDPFQLYGEPPPYYGDASLLPVPPPPDVTGIGPPAPMASPFDAAQYLPPPPPPDNAIAAFQLDPSAPAAAPPVPPVPALPDLPPPVQSLPSQAAAPPLAAPDALSDASGMPVAGALGGQPYAPTLTPEQHYAQTLQQYADRPFDIPNLAEQQRYLNDLALRDPAKFADITLQHEDARKKEEAAQRQRIANENYDRQMANLRARDEARAKVQQQTDQVMAEAQRLAAEKIDPSGGLSTGQRIAGVLSSIVGGLVQGRTGAARNAGLDSFIDTVNRGIEAQKADMANRRGMLEFRRSALGQAYERTGDMFVAAESVRQASYQHAVELIDADMQNWDPRGTQAMRRAKLRADLLTNQAKSLLTFQNEQHDRDMKDRKQRYDEKKIEADIANQRADLNYKYAALGEQRAQRKAAEQNRLADKAAERADKQAETERKFSVGGAPKIATGADGKPLYGADGKPIITYDRVRNAKGDIWTPPDDVHKEVVEKTAATHSLLNVYDRILALRDRVGGESGLFNSDEYQELKGLEKEALLLKKQGTQGMSSDKDMENLVDAAGVNDVTSFRARAAGIKAARDRVVKQLDNVYRAATYDGPPLKFDNPYTGATNNEQDDKLEPLLRKPSLTFEDVLSKELSDRQIAAGRESGLDITNNPADQALYREAYQAAQARFDPNASPHQQDRIAELSTVARGDDKAAQDARTDLQKIASEAKTTRLRELARAALEDAVRTRGSEERTTTSSGGLRAPLPGPTSAPPPPIPDELRLR